MADYNGWKNWETWNVALWCDNEEWIYRERMARKVRTAEDVEAFVRECYPEGTPDMLTREIDPFEHDAVSVDWQEIAEHWAEDYEDEDENAEDEENA